MQQLYEGWKRGDGQTRAHLVTHPQLYLKSRAQAEALSSTASISTTRSETIRPAVATALKYGLIDLVRIEQMILRRAAGAYFRLPTDTENPHER